ncbi:MAG: ATP-binding protein [Acidobacteriota bacterium]|nr:ATP-binding protein [Acidobacteriota bacterium]
MARVRSVLTGYLTAAVSVAVAVGITFAILQTKGFRAAIAFPYLLAILASAWWGYGPGLFACALSYLAVPYIFNPHFDWAKIDPNRVTLTVLISLLVSRVAVVTRRSQELLRLANEQLELRVRERTAELARSNAELEQYAYVASHDLQEPLRTISTMAGLFVKRYRGQLGGDAEELLGYIETSVRRMHNLINDLLTYSRTMGDEHDVKTPVNLEDTLLQVIGAYESELQASGTIVTHDALPTLPVEATQLGQVFQNLLSNAIKYRNPEETPRIHFGARHTAPEWTFSVADNGLGIDPDYHERIFGLFKRLHGAQVPGTGIGLAICKRIVERHHGRIWVESSAGAGSTFLFTLPDAGTH